MSSVRGLLSEFFSVIGEASEEFANDRARRLAASLAYYSLFALVPTIMLAALIAATIVGAEAATGSLADGLENNVGADAAEQIQESLADLWENVDTSGFALVSLAVVLFSASILFVAWRDMIGLIWGLPFELSATATLRKRIFALLVPVAAGLVFAAALLIELVMGFLEHIVDAALLDAALRTAGSVVPAAAAFGALSLLYRYSADNNRPVWRNVLPGAALATAVLAVGSWVYGLYIRLVGYTSVTGAASTILVGMVVVYYAAQILLFGGEVIKVLGMRQADSPRNGKG